MADVHDQQSSDQSNGGAVSITQLSDTHFLAEGAEKGPFDYDTFEAFQTVYAHGLEATDADLVVVTGDVADHGDAGEYERAVTALNQIPVNVNVCPGNHDYDIPFMSGMAGPRIALERIIERGSWCFIFADSNLEGRELDDHGNYVDTDQRIEGIGQLGPAEAAWIVESANSTKAEHVWVWVHHPPGVAGAMYSPSYTAEWEAILEQTPKIRGLGGGHTHTVEHFQLAGREVVICPSLKLNVDVRARTLLPPGYRTYRFQPDGSVQTECHLMDDSRWPRLDLPEAAMEYLTGKISYAEMMTKLGVGAES